MVRLRRALLGLLAPALFASLAGAQTLTSGSLSGVVTDVQTAVVPGASIVVMYEPTGERVEATTDGAGTFRLLNLRVGGPFTVSARLAGFADRVEHDVFIGLGEERALTFVMPPVALAFTVEVTPSSSAFDPARSGTAANIRREAVAALPTIARSLTDLVRTSPYVNPISANGGEALPSVAGTNNWFNTIQIDGTANNDLYGLARTGSPGGSSGSQPISLDVVREIQLVVAPYDVRQGGFSGGGLNVVTNGGGNNVHGAVYGFAQSAQFVGDIPALIGPDKTSVGPFTSRQFGGSLGGPVKRNRAFLFGNVESSRQSTPTAFSISGNAGQPWGHQAEVTEVLDIMRTRYGYNPGSLDQVVTATDNDKVFIRADVNHRGGRLTARVNYLNGRTAFGAPTALLYLMPDTYGQFGESVWSGVTQLNSTRGRLLNELRLGVQRYRGARNGLDGQTTFPAVRVFLSDGTAVRLGTDPLSFANSLNQDAFELTDDLTWARGAHTITFGGHAERLHFENLFVQNFYGFYDFSSIDLLRAGLAQSYARQFSNTADPRQTRPVAARDLSAYAGDAWRIAPRLTLTYGMRLDASWLPDTPQSNPLALSAFGYATDVVPWQVMWSPRVGFNWALDGESRARAQIRGGAGLFAGRPPYGWLTNQYVNTGLDYTTLTLPLAATRRIPFIADPNGQPTTVGNAGLQTINLIDPAFKFPQVLRGNLAADRGLGVWGLVGTIELVASHALSDPAFTNLNYIATGVAPDGRLTYSKKSPALNDVVLMSNQSAGHEWSASARAERPFARGASLSASYLLERSTSVNDGVSLTAANIWGATYTGYDVNNPPPTTSNYQVGQRITIAGVVPVPMFGHMRSDISFYFNSQSGQPYVLVMNGDVNGDGRANNDIAFVPASSNQVVVTGGTWAQLDAYLAADPSSQNYRGLIPPRNAGTSPWTRTLDLRYAIELPATQRARAQLTVNVANVLNLLNDQWGWVTYPALNGPTTLTYGGIDLATGKLIYRLNTITSPSFTGTFTRDDLRSRWRAQFGLRVSF